MNRLLIISLCFVLPSISWASNWDEYASDDDRQNALVTTAYEQSHKYGYRRDCSGFIESILSNVGHDLYGFTRLYDVRANGVRQIYEYIQRTGTISEKKMPSLGDIVFFSNTYDQDRDRKLDDDLTHIGIVTSVDQDGTVAFMHILRKKVIVGFMNLYKPNVVQENGKTLNSYLRRARRNGSYPVLAAQLFDFFGSLNP